MPHGTIAEVIPAPSREVFHVLHNYKRCLEWDSLLRKAVLVDCQEARVGAHSYCQAKWRLGGIGVAARYVSFEPGRLAAVKMTNRPWFFETFAASIRHEDLPGGASRIEYQFQFLAKPRWLRFALHPVMRFVLGVETRKRLRGLKRFVKASSLRPL
jgi:hypothetical protein